VLIDNRPGASGIIGSEIVAKWADIIRQAGIRPD